MDTALQPRNPELLKNGIKGIHEAFADYILINPGCTLRQVGAHFGYSPAWICTVMNSDMFKAYFVKRRAEVSAMVAEDLPTKLQAAGHLATERIMEVLSTSSDPDTLIDAFDKVLNRCGYAPNAKGGQQGGQQAAVINNVFYLNKGELADARQKLLAAHAAPAAPAVVDMVVNEPPVPAA